MTDETLHRTLSRLAAIQILYALDSKEEPIDNNMNIESAIKDSQKYYKEFCDEKITYNKLNMKFLKRLIALTAQNISTIDSLIYSNLNKKQINPKINSLLKAILRSGICEILYFKTPPKVTINEYVTITKDFFSITEAGFVNALLDKIKSNH